MNPGPSDNTGIGRSSEWVKGFDCHQCGPVWERRGQVVSLMG